jgi:hypothetical protein
MEKKLNVFLIQKKIQKNFKKISKKDSVKLFSQYIIIYIYGVGLRKFGGSRHAGFAVKGIRTNSTKRLSQIII